MLTGDYPLYFEGARGNRITDVDGHTYIDFCLGDTGAMTGHSPQVVLDAIDARLRGKGGITTMLPTEDAAFVGAELQRRFGLPYWQFSLTATDANRWVLRMARMVQKRPYVLVFSECYHGTVDETIVVVGPDGKADGQAGQRRPAGGPDADHQGRRVQRRRRPARGARAARRRRRAHGAVDDQHRHRAGRSPGSSRRCATLCDETGTLLVNDETHTISAGVGGATRALGLRPDIVTIGKAIASGVPMGAYGVTEELAGRVLGDPDADLVDQGGVGGTLAGNALASAAARATLEHVLTEENFAHMTALATRYTEGVQGVLDEYRVPWVVIQLGAAPSTASRPSCRAPVTRAARRTTASSRSTCTCTPSTAASS